MVIRSVALLGQRHVEHAGDLLDAERVVDGAGEGEVEVMRVRNSECGVELQNDDAAAVAFALESLEQVSLLRFIGALDDHVVEFQAVYLRRASGSFGVLLVW